MSVSGVSYEKQGGQWGWWGPVKTVRVLGVVVREVEGGWMCVVCVWVCVGQLIPIPTTTLAFPKVEHFQVIIKSVLIFGFVFWWWSKHKWTCTYRGSSEWPSYNQSIPALLSICVYGDTISVQGDIRMYVHIWSWFTLLYGRN